MFVWKPVTILKLNLYLNLRMKSFTCWECVESLCSWITGLQKISKNQCFDSYRFENQKGGNKEP